MTVRDDVLAVNYLMPEPITGDECDRVLHALGLANYEIKKRSPEKGRRAATPDTATDRYAADWFDNPHLGHGGTYGVRGPRGLVHATGPFKKDWEKAQTMAAEMNAVHDPEAGAEGIGGDRGA